MDSGLLSQLGINWKLLLSQTVNFFIVLVVLWRFVYRPLLAVIKKRNEAIKTGLEKAQEADTRLQAVDAIAKKHLQKADHQAQQIIKTTEQKAEALKQSLQQKAQEHQEKLLAQAELAHQRQQEETQKLVFSQALELVKSVIIKTVELKPEAVDEALIRQAVKDLKHEA